MGNHELIFEKGLPSNLDREKFVLGQLIYGGFAPPDIAALDEKLFSTQAHRNIFHALTRLEFIDGTHLAQSLKESGELESIGGFAYLADLSKEAIPEIPIKGHLEALRTLSASRTMIEVMYTSSDALAASPDEVTLAKIKQQIDSITPISKTEALTSGLMTPGQAVESLDGGLSAFLDPSKRPKGLYTGFLGYDQLTQGLHPGELVIVAARPSMGKTALVLNIAAHVAGKLRKTVAVFSLEMSRISLYSRLLCSIARIDSAKFRLGMLNAEERRSLMRTWQEIHGWNLRVDDSADTGITEMRMHLDKMNSPADLVIVDYLQLMSTKGNQQNRNEEVSGLSRGLKKLARERNVPVIALSQLSRDVEKRTNNRPQMSDLRDSGGIEQDADVIAFIFREEVYKQDRQDLKGMAELIVAKHRNGATKAIPLVWLSSITKFENRAEDTEWSQHNDD